MLKDKELTKKEMFEIFNRRYACKKYDKTKVVSDEDFMTIIEAGRISPSSFGLEPWKFILVYVIFIFITTRKCHCQQHHYKKLFHKNPLSAIN